MTQVTWHGIRDAIADVLAEHYKNYELEAACDRLGLPKVQDAWTHNSKRAYVRTRLAGVDLTTMIELAVRIVGNHEAPILEAVVARTGLHGVDGEMKNLIFAAVGRKPRIVLRDAINNIIEIVEGADRCLVYDRPLTHAGLTWDDLVRWWSARSNNDEALLMHAHDLYRRLGQSLDSPPERTLFKAYCGRYARSCGGTQPAIVPQVYLHYDPYTARELTSTGGAVLARQRMDFLLLPSSRRRIVLEVDGQQHYSDSGRPAPQRYSDMVAEDRRLRLRGYEVFRFGGWELSQSSAGPMLGRFFNELLGD